MGLGAGFVFGPAIHGHRAHRGAPSRAGNAGSLLIRARSVGIPERWGRFARIVLDHTRGRQASTRSAGGGGGEPRSREAS